MKQLQEIKLSNFKCFQKAVVPLGRLTLLTGGNGTGKSTVIQALLLLRQSWEANLVARGELELAGRLCTIPAAGYAFNRKSEEKSMGIGLSWEDGTSADWAFSAASHYSLTLDAVNPPEMEKMETELGWGGPPFNRWFNYLPAALRNASSCEYQVIDILEDAHEKLLLVEHPEAFLDAPKQTDIGLAAARSAACGSQIVLETHSDHVLNGVRVAVHNGVIPADQVCILFFEPDGKMTRPIMDSGGRLDYWPAGFFDEWDKALSRLIRMGQ